MTVELVADVYAATDPREGELVCGVYMPRKGAWLGRYYIPQPEREENKMLSNERKKEMNNSMYFEYIGSNSAQVCGCGKYSFGGGDPCGCGAGWDNADWTTEGYKFPLLNGG